MMSEKQQVNVTNTAKGAVYDSSFKVIEVNVSDVTESLYAVVTPVKK
ncbi:hypothetical protein LCL95_04240 [Bacillus timonensis]|nr:hypothetical protein [Bacillus timonensis]